MSQAINKKFKHNKATLRIITRFTDGKLKKSYMLNEQEKKRYLRQLLLPEIQEDGQLMLKNSKVFIAGAGGLGGPVAFYLAAAGVGHMVLCDRDVVELSNLNRQILHGTHDIDLPKTTSAKESLEALNPEIKVEVIHTAIDENNMPILAVNCDLIVDCLDNISTRLFLNDYSIASGVPIIHAGIDKWAGQISLIKSPETACLNCLFENYEEPQGAKPVLGAVAGIIGTMQALEVIKYLTNTGHNLKNKLLYFDALSLEWTKLPIEKNPQCKVCMK